MGSLRFPDPQLADSEIVLRPWAEHDIARVVEAVSDPAIVRWSHLPEPFDSRAAWRRFLAMPDERARGTALRMLITDASDDRMLGAIALQRIDWDNRSGELGYWVTASARGRGVAARAIGLMTGWAFSELRLGRVDAIPDLDNHASRRLLERCGFEFAGKISERTPPAALYSMHARSVMH
jgi:RimJ/RimL family protein N-acetyltransferase